MNLINSKTFERVDENRRQMLRLMAMGAVFASRPGAYADELVKTPAQTEGPFFPNKLPLDTDNDLLIINSSTSPSSGEVAWVSGRILDPTGQPLRNALVEIWQADANGAYLHTGSDNGDKRDRNFQGYGRFLTGSTGEYGFRTIKPVPYPGRSPHIHYKISQGGKNLLTTQCYVKGHPGNARDMVLKGIKDKKQLESVMVEFKPLEGSKIGELMGRFDVVLGYTPKDACQNRHSWPNRHTFRSDSRKTSLFGKAGSVILTYSDEPPRAQSLLKIRLLQMTANLHGHNPHDFHKNRPGASRNDGSSSLAPRFSAYHGHCSRRTFRNGHPGRPCCWQRHHQGWPCRLWRTRHRCC